MGYKMAKVLVVEDNPLNMELALEVLGMHGIKAHEANDGEETVIKSEKEDYDLILMDIELAKIDGVEATRVIKGKNKNVPIIALTSYAMKGDKELFFAAGFDKYMSKPIEISEFLKKLEKYCL
jgi:CheY-like chemotaxis protein